MTNRRHFLIGTATALAATATRRGWAEADEAKRDRVSVMSLDFSPILKSPAHPDDPKRMLDILDYADMLAEHYGVHHVEFQHSHFNSTETAYLQEVKERLKKAKSQMNQINLEFGTLNISATDPMVRLETIDLTKQWIDHAAFLGCPHVMINQGTLAPDVRQAAIDTMKAMVAYGKPKKVAITMENRGGGGGRGRGGAQGQQSQQAQMANAAPMQPRPVGATWQVVVEVLKAAGGYANPDIGNFPDEEQRHDGERVMFKMTAGGAHCHYAPDRWDFDAAMAIPRELGYKGTFSIEHSGPDPYAAVQTVLDAILKNL
jgi:sugar phosphate isomerase/epimerase